MSFDEPRPPRRSSESTTRTTLSGDDSSPERRSAWYKLNDRSPKKYGNSQEMNTRMNTIQELSARLHREVRARDSAIALLSGVPAPPYFPAIPEDADDTTHSGANSELDINLMLSEVPNSEPPSPKTQNKPSVMHTVRQFTTRKFSPESQQRKARAQLETAEREISEIQRQLQHLGIEDDDDLSSGDDDEVPTRAAPGSLLHGEYALQDDEGAIVGGSTSLGLMSSATSSALDLSSMSRQIPVSSRDDECADLVTLDSSFYQSSVHNGSSNNNNGTSDSGDVLLTKLILMLETLDHRQPSVHTSVERIYEFVYQNPQLKQELRTRGPWALAAEKIKAFLLDKNAVIRCLGFRLLKLVIVDLGSLTFFRHQLFLDLQFVQILSKDDYDKNHDLRLTVIQLIRVIVNIPGGATELSQSVYRALIAVSEQHNDGTRYVCQETLAELLVIDAEKVFEAGGVQLLLSSMVNPGDGTEGPPSREYALALAMGFLDASDRPSIRQKYLRDGKDISALLTNFTDVQLYGFISPSKELLQSSAAVMEVLMRSWVGIFMFNFSLFVKCMTMPVESTQSTLLEVLDHVLWIPDTQRNLGVSAPSSNAATVLLCQFTAILLRCLQQSGLQEQLVTLQRNGETESIRALAEELGSKVFRLSSQLIPRYEIVSRSMALSTELAEDLSKQPSHKLPTTSMSLFGAEAKLKESLARESAKPSLDTFIRLGVNIDDGSFKRLVNATHVLDTKAFRQWNWDALMELVQGPLRCSRRFDELSKNSKFLKRLFVFYRPFKYKFSDLELTKENLRYVDVGKEMVKSMMETPEGLRYLSQNKLFRQIGECLAQVDPISGFMSPEPIFTERRFRMTLCRAYAEFIGILSQSHIGQQILAQVRIFNLLYRLCDINRDDVMRIVICSLSYRHDGHPRLILSKALSAASSSTRLFATEFVGVRMASREPAFWAIDLMVEQLYDTEPQVAKAAADSLLRMCSHSEAALDYLICSRPYIDHLGDSANDLRTLFMSRPTGFELLKEELEQKDSSGWISNIRDSYVDQIETYLESESVSFEKSEQAAKMAVPFQFPTYSRPHKHQSLRCQPPSHFYGELALTEQGCRFLQNKGLIAELRSVIEDAANNCEKDWSIKELRNISAVLWAIGHIASRPKGVLLCDADMVQKICRICQNAQVFSLRGTAYYVLGMFAFSMSGAEFLHQCGWGVVYDVYNQPIGVALPPASYDLQNSQPSERKRDIKRLTGVTVTKGYMLETEKPEAKKLELESFASEKPEHRPITSSTTTSNTKLRGEAIISKSPSKSPIKLKPTTARSPTKALDRTLRQPENSTVSIESLSKNINKIPEDDRASLKSATMISANSLVSPRSSTSHHIFDFEIDPSLSSRRSSCFDLIDFPPKRDDTVDLIMHAISQLGSSVLSQSATKRLVAMRASYPFAFQREDLACEVLEILGTGNYRQVTRRFIFELLDIRAVLEKVYRRNRFT